MQINFLVLLCAALVPMVTGFIWYNPKVFGTAWMNETGFTPEKAKGKNMVVIYILCVILSFLLSFALQFMVIHQWGAFSTLATDPSFQDPTSVNGMYFADFMAKYGNNFRTFKHGVLHGVMAGFTIALPILGTNAMFEGKGFKYIAINVGYWIITMGLMGGIICQFS
ncbi:MAG: DUF1761 domain-containing protein [Bacteroidota bacterium]|nr:DUF1761 domain-containing protein [Bacteroidota bacterium]